MGSTHWSLVARIIRSSPTRLRERPNAKSCSSIRRKIARVLCKKRSIDNHLTSQHQLPAFAKMLLHNLVIIMKMNCLDRLQELAGSVEKERPIFNRKRADILPTNPTDALHFCVLRERFGHVVQGGGHCVLRSEP